MSNLYGNEGRTSQPPSNLVAPTARCVVPTEEVNTIVGPVGLDVAKSKNKYLVAVDRSEDSELAFEWVIGRGPKKASTYSSYLRTRHPPADLHAHVDHVFLCSVIPASMYDPVGPYGDAETGFLESADVLRVLRDLRTRMTTFLQGKAEELKSRGIETTIHIMHGDPRYAICAAADYHDIHTVVMGRRHHTGYLPLQSGASVSSFVVAHCSKSVLVVKQEGRWK